MATLSGFDQLIIVFYFAVLLGIGWYSSRRQHDEDYLIASRNLDSWSTMATINASKTGSILMIFVALTYLWGFSAVWYFIGVIIGVFLFIPFSMRLKEKSTHTYYTLADYFKYNYGERTAKFASILTIIGMVGFLVLNLIAGSKLFVFFTGWPFWCAQFYETS
jgi:solute:Na+ symporter, SSS family